MFSAFRKNTSGSVTVETSLVLMLMIAFTGGAVEGAYAFSQWNSAQEAARIGARIAATSDPVSRDISTMTGLTGNTQPGDPMPNYTRRCTGNNQSCNRGRYDRTAMNGIVFGPDNDGVCSKTTRERAGMCDMFGDIELKNVDIKYVNSGLGKAGYPGDPAPLITVTLKNLKFNFVFLDIFLPASASTMPDVNVTVMSEDLKTGV